MQWCLNDHYTTQGKRRIESDHTQINVEFQSDIRMTACKVFEVIILINTRKEYVCMSVSPHSGLTYIHTCLYMYNQY